MTETLSARRITSLTRQASNLYSARVTSGKHKHILLHCEIMAVMKQKTQSIHQTGRTPDRMGGSPAKSLPPPSPPAEKPHRRASAPDLSVVFKKSSPNNKLTLYLSSRDIVVSERRVDKLRGVLLVDSEYVQDHKDEEVMGLRFCNEAVMSLTKLYPPPDTPTHEGDTDRAEEKPSRRATVRMGIRVLQRCPCLDTKLPRARGSPARATVERPFLLSEGRVRLEAALDRASYRQGEPVHVRVTVYNRSAKSVRRVKILVVQHVDVCMFSNGKFKNVVAAVNSRQDCPISPGNSVRQAYALYPTKGATKNWIALEDSYTRQGGSGSLAATVKLIVGAMGSEVSVKLPFDLLPSEEAEVIELSDTPKRSTSDHGEVKVELNGERSAGSSGQRPTKIGATA
ncbi:hypothetical protein B566_EDAN010224, partial [Ephemera danica]